MGPAPLRDAEIGAGSAVKQHCPAAPAAAAESDAAIAVGAAESAEVELGSERPSFPWPPFVAVIEGSSGRPLRSAPRN